MSNKTYCSFILIDFGIGEIGQLFIRIDRNQNGPDIRINVVVHETFLQVVQNSLIVNFGQQHHVVIPTLFYIFWSPVINLNVNNQNESSIWSFGQIKTPTIFQSLSVYPLFSFAFVVLNWIETVFKYEVVVNVLTLNE